jgi:transcriptional regulator with XRE-family HTH domain
MCTQLHERLKQARERRRISLATIARQWGVREQNLELIERDRFEDLPTGLYGRAAVRAYATAVGLPADQVLAEVADRLRSPEDPLDGLARVRGLTRQPERTLKEILHMPATDINLNLSTTTRAQVANVIDALFLLFVDFVLLELTALVAGVRSTEVLRAAAPAMIALFALIAALYFVLLGGLARTTVGTKVAHTSVDPAMVEGVVRMLRLRRA